MDMNARTGIAAITAVATVVTVALAFSSVTAAAGTKSHPPNLWAGLSHAQKNAIVEQTHAQNMKYLQDFEARHGDPRSLPVIRIDTYQGPPASFGSAAADATVVMQGVVREVHFAADPLLLLTQPQPHVNLYRPVYGAGAYFLRNGVLAGEAATRYGLAGQRLAARWRIMSSNQLSNTLQLT